MKKSMFLIKFIGAYWLISLQHLHMENILRQFSNAARKFGEKRKKISLGLKTKREGNVFSVDEHHLDQALLTVLVSLISTHSYGKSWSVVDFWN